MNACGLIVEYNPFHNGHLYHLQQSKKQSNADCVVAIMSGSFLQRGEPAIIDKFHRTRAALLSGVDIVLELPYAFAVQSSQLFAKGAVHTLNELGINAICFGSESGNISDFIDTYYIINENKQKYNNDLKHYLSQGYSFPHANQKAVQSIGIHDKRLNLSEPNNILGFSYVRTILENRLQINPMTVRRHQTNYHDKKIHGTIASATSIRQQLYHDYSLDKEDTKQTIPDIMKKELLAYKQKTGTWHYWDHYLPLIYYRVLTMTSTDLSKIHGMDEGIENRVLKTIKNATSFDDWVKSIKTKRYTWTRIQRMFTHLLTNTKKEELNHWLRQDSVPYIRLLGATGTGRAYLNTRKKSLNVPLITSISKQQHPLLSIEEQATNAYYSIFSAGIRNELHQQEMQSPIMI